MEARTNLTLIGPEGEEKRKRQEAQMQKKEFAAQTVG